MSKLLKILLIGLGVMLILFPVGYWFVHPGLTEMEMFRQFLFLIIGGILCLVISLFVKGKPRS